MKNVDKNFLLKNLGRLSEAVKFALMVYRGVLTVKIFTVDTIIKGIDLAPKKHTNIKQDIIKVIETQSKQEDNLQKSVTVKEKNKMKKSSVIAAFVSVAAVGAALGAAAYYLYKKEQELNDYEDMLFSEEHLSGYMPEDSETQEESIFDDCGCGCDCGCTQTPETTKIDTEEVKF